MLREEQIDLRRQRAKAGKFTIENLGKNRVHSEFRVTNPETEGQYAVNIRGFDVGDNTCSCPDFKANTLGTCKHIEAVLETLKDELPPHLQKKKAIVNRSEIILHYGEQLQLGIHLPARHSDKLAKLRLAYFDEKNLWTGRGKYPDLIRDIEDVPEDVTVVSDALDFIDREIERTEMLAREREWLRQLEAGDLDRNLLNVPLYDYQMRGALFLACRGRCILGDDMGLGKTVQTLAAVELLARERNLQKALVIAPASVKYQWETEIRKFTTRPVQVIEGGKETRQEQYEEPTFYRLVNYEQVIRDREAINAWKPDVVILDEAQRIKNWESKTSREVKKLKSRYALVLTGTPLENKLEELYSIVQFVDERRFGPAFQFLHEHRVLDEAGNLTGYRNLDAIRDKLAPIFLRRTRGEVLTQLPARTDSIIFVELADEQRRHYEEQRTNLARLLQKNFLTDLDRKRVLACLINMRMICDSLFLFDKQSRVSPKLDEFAELMPELLLPSPRWGEGGEQSEPGEGRKNKISSSLTPFPNGESGLSTPHKAVVFSQWETMVLEAGKVLDTLGVGYAILHGGLTGKERKESLTRFAGDPACQVFLSTDAGGTGLNLQHADTVVNLELPWNPAVLEQRIARVHRMGQNRPVRVVNFVTRGTVEERVLRTLEAKQGLFNGLFAGDEDEIAFEATGASRFLETMRGLLDERMRPTEPEPVTMPDASRTPTVWQAAIHLLEGVSMMLSAQPAPEEIREKLREQIRALGEKL
ncbi:MAG TPA: DEAD/DEAH box helicase [Urbifossiella sp.]|jgi:SNF2 family DNA or RNA helicase